MRQIGRQAMTGLVAARFLLAGLSAAGITLAGTSAQAQDDWPNRPVRVISTFAAGGTADILARVVAEHLSTAFKQQFFVEVRSGAGGQIGVKTTMESPPDGYTLAITNVSHLVLHPMTRSDVTYNPLKDLTNIAYVGGSPVVLSVNAEKSGIKSLKEFVDRGKTQSLSYSSSGLGSMGHLVAVSFTNLAKIKTEHVPYKGASQGLNDLVGGHIIFASQTVSSTANMIRAGQLKGLAVATEKRMPDWADLPTFKEQGYDVEAAIWFALSGPPNMPPALVKRINEEVIRGLEKPEVAERMRKDGLIHQPMTPAQFAAFIDRETKRWGPVVKDAGLEAAKTP